MKERLNKFIHSRVFIIVLVGLLMCTTLLVGTYAWFTWSSADNTKLVMTIGRMADVVFTSGNDINGDLTPVYNYSDGLSTSFTINNRDESGTIIGYNVNLNITSIAPELISNDVKWAIEKNGKLVKEGDFSTSSNGTTINLYSSTTSTGTASYTIYLYIDGNVENNPNMMGKNINGTIVVEASEGEINLLNHITSLYTENYDSSYNVAFADGSGMNYYAPSVRLMNDGLDSTGKEVDEALAVNGTAGNIRYYGTDDNNLNNYIYFNCSDYSNQSSSTCEKWRIIGIVDGKVKLIRNDLIGHMAWDQDKNQDSNLTTFSSDWETSSLQLLLNGLYYNRGETTTHIYYSGGEGEYEEELNLERIGITKATRDNDLISSSIWYTNERWAEYSNTAYSEERYGDSKLTGKIGLIYPSDYGYAAALNSCQQSLWNYDSEECMSTNWTTTIFNGTDGMSWTITPVGYWGGAWIVWNGSITYDDAGTATDTFAVVPVLYLNPELIIGKGNGSSELPYQISIDTEAPSCTLSVTSNNISFNTKNDNIGVTAYGLSTSNTATYGGENSIAIGTGTIYGYVKDRAGNTGSCSAEILEINDTGTFHTFNCSSDYHEMQDEVCYNKGYDYYGDSCEVSDTLYYATEYYCEKDVFLVCGEEEFYYGTAEEFDPNLWAADDWYWYCENKGAGWVSAQVRYSGRWITDMTYDNIKFGAYTPIIDPNNSCGEDDDYGYKYGSISGYEYTGSVDCYESSWSCDDGYTNLDDTYCYRIN